MSNECPKHSGYDGEDCPKCKVKFSPSKIQYEGACHRVSIVPRKDYSPLILIETEDDGNWFEAMVFDIGWLPEFAEIVRNISLSNEAIDALADITQQKANGTHYK